MSCCVHPCCRSPVSRFSRLSRRNTRCPHPLYIYIAHLAHRWILAPVYIHKRLRRGLLLFLYPSFPLYVARRVCITNMLTLCRARSPPLPSPHPSPTRVLSSHPPPRPLRDQQRPHPPSLRRTVLAARSRHRHPSYPLPPPTPSSESPLQYVSPAAVCFYLLIAID